MYISRKMILGGVVLALLFAVSGSLVILYKKLHRVQGALEEVKEQRVVSQSRIASVQSYAEVDIAATKKQRLVALQSQFKKEGMFKIFENNIIPNDAENLIKRCVYPEIVPWFLERISISHLELKGHKDYVNSAMFNGAGDKIVTASFDKTVKIWDVETGKCLVTLIGHKKWVRSAMFNGAGDKIVTADDKTVKIWNIETGKCIVTLQGHKKWVASAMFNGAGNKIVTASADRTAKIWDIGKLLSIEKELNELTLEQVVAIYYSLNEVYKDLPKEVKGILCHYFKKKFNVNNTLKIKK